MMLTDEEISGASSAQCNGDKWHPDREEVEEDGALRRVSCCSLLMTRRRTVLEVAMLLLR